MRNEYLVYLQEILDTSWVVELISEQFDNALNMMTTNSIVYGGAVRDCLAGKTLFGDLDIIVPSAEHHLLVNRFIKSPKWVLINRTQKRNLNNTNTLQKLYSSKKTGYKAFNPFLSANNNHQYKNFNISGITSFKTLGNKIVQIIELPITNNTPFQSAVDFVKQVDIVCCGVILTINGKVFEVVPNAYDDCKKGILCLNKSFNINNLEIFQSRIKKLVARGWYDAVDVDQITKSMKKKRKVLNQTNKIIPKNTHTLRFNYAKTNSTIIKNNDEYKIFIPNRNVTSLGGKTKLFSLLGHIAKIYQLDIIIQVKLNGVTITTIDEVINRFVYRKIFDIKKKPIQTFSPDKKSYMKWGMTKFSMPQGGAI